MRALVQRVTAGSVVIDGETVGEIGPGLVILLGVAPDDTAKDAAWLAAKCANLRIFEDEAGKMNRSLLETGRSSRCTGIAPRGGVPSSAEPPNLRWQFRSMKRSLPK